MNASHNILLNYPLSSDFRRRLEDTLDQNPSYINLPELRRLSIVNALRRLRAMRGTIISIPLEDDSESAALPLLKIAAGIADAKVVQLVRPDLSRERVSRWNQVQTLFEFLAASGASYASMKASRYELQALIRQPRISPDCSVSRRALYLNANLWFGVKAGGSVGHIAGVVNGLTTSGFDLDFASAGGRQMVSDRATHIPLTPPRAFGMPFETNHYRFSRQVVSQLEEVLRKNPYAFLYQRMSIANYSGVVLTRRHKLPLVLEYNGSEAWVAKNWGRPLRYHANAVLAEEICLQHAHVVVTISDVLRDQLIARRVDPSRIVTYPNCVDPEMFNSERITHEERCLTRKQYGISEDALVAEFIGTFGQWHGVALLAHTIRRLVETQIEWLRRHRMHFLIVGDGVKMAEVRQILAASVCQPFYTLTGLVPQKEAPRHIAAADILLSPHVANADGSRFFGSPTKLFEYMAMGRAILAADLDQIGQVLAKSIHTKDIPGCDLGECKGEMAVLFPTGDVDSLIVGLRFLAENPRWRHGLGANARREALARYTWQHHVGAILGKLRELKLLS